MPDDVKQMAQPVLAHRLILKPESRLRKRTPAAVVNDLVADAKVPITDKTEGRAGRLLRTIDAIAKRNDLVWFAAILLLDRPRARAAGGAGRVRGVRAARRVPAVALPRATVGARPSAPNASATPRRARSANRPK